MPFTPVWSLPYPCAGDTIDPTIFCDFSQAVDDALGTINANAEFVANRPNARMDRVGNANTFAAGVASNVQFNTETFDNSGMIDLALNNTLATISTEGVYWVCFSVGGFSTFTTWTRYQMAISQNGTNRIYRKYMVNTAQGTPGDNTIQGVLVCTGGDTVRGSFTFIGTGGPMQISRASLSISFICDL